MKKYQTKSLIDKIKRKYENIDISIHHSKSDISLFRIVFNEEDDYDKFLTDIYIQRQLDFFGYYVNENIDDELTIFIEPNFGTKCTNFVYNNCNGLIFHVTDKETYINNIKYSGLKPKYGDIRKYRYFNERIFLTCGETKEEIIDNIKLIIDQKGYKPDNYVLLMVDLKKTKYNVDFYYDPSEDNWHNCIYCNAWFPYRYITEVRKLTDLNVNIDENLKVADAPWHQT